MVAALLCQQRAAQQRLDDQVRLATVNLQLRARTIPGPVGAANQGLWWGLKKLFVLN